MSSNIGFYYPQNVFPDDWMKLAVLYWDKIARIKWKRGPLGDSDTVRQLADEMDFVINLTPSSRELSFVADNFIETISKHKDVLQRHYSRVSREGRRPVISIDSDLISSDFMTTELFDIIIKSGLGWWFFETVQ